MADRFIMTTLKRLPLFQSYSDAQIAMLANRAQVTRYQAGEMVFQQGHTSRGLYLFISGRGVLVQHLPGGSQRQIGEVIPYQYINEIALQRPIQESATLYAVETSIVLLLPREPYMALLADPDFWQAAQGRVPGQPTQPPAVQPAAPSPANPDGGRTIPVPRNDPDATLRAMPPVQGPVPGQGQGGVAPAANPSPATQPSPAVPPYADPPPYIAPTYAQPPHQQPRPSSTVQGGPPRFRQPGYMPPSDYESPAGVRPDGPGFGPLDTDRTALPGVPPVVTQEPGAPVAPREGLIKTPVNELVRQFEGQRQGERTLLMTRRHIWAFWRRIWQAVLVAALIFVITALVQVPFVQVILLLANLLVPGLIILYHYLEWSNDWLIITDQRVLHIEQVILTFSTRISEIPLKSIVSVNEEIPRNDLFARLFGYGTVEIRTPGERANVNMTVIPNPDRVQDFIFAERERVVAEESMRRKREMIEGALDEVMGHPRPASPNPNPDTDSAVKPTPATSGGLLRMRYITDEGETVYRKHWVMWMRQVMPAAFLMLIGIAVIIGGLAIPVLTDLGVIAPLFGFFILIMGAIWFYWSDWDWRNDLYIISNRMVSLIHRRPLWLQYEDDQILLTSIDNTVADMNGFFRSLLGYGDVKIFPIGDETPKVFRNVPNPRQVREEISRRQKAAAHAIEEAADKRNLQATVEAIQAYHSRYGTGNPPPETSDGGNVPPSYDRNRPGNIPRARRS